MLCPLRLVRQKRGLGGASFGQPEQVEDFDICAEGDCAWWDPEVKKCIIHSLSEIEKKISTLLKTADNKS